MGKQIDQSHSRLRTLLLTISTNRVSVMLACLGWYLLLGTRSPTSLPSYSKVSILRSTTIPEPVSSLWLFVLVIGLGILEKLSGIGNMICMERDWVPILTSTSNAEMQTNFSLTHLNSVMRRIDLLCKLISPLIISVVILATSTPVGIALVGLMSTASWFVEIYCARRVWFSSGRLRKSKEEPHALNVATGDASSTSRPTSNGPTLNGCLKQWSQFSDYFSTDIWIPSLSLALLHLSVLSYSATFVTFCLNSGFSLLAITIARAAGSVVEVSSTFITPFGISHLATSKGDRDQTEDHQGLLDGSNTREPKEHSIGLARSGLWGVILQLVTLVGPILPQLDLCC